MATKTEIAWAAGLFEGEGCIYFADNGSGGEKRYVRLNIRMNDEDVLRRFWNIVDNAGGFSGPHVNQAGNDFWSVQIGHATDVEKILISFWPYLGQRRKAKAREALKKIRRIGIRHRGGRQLGDYCSRGHRISVSNHVIRIDRGVVSMRCRQCMQVAGGG